jgi:hypothetical protein
MHMPAKAVRSIVVVVSLLVMGLSATTASAATEVKTVKGEVVFAFGQRPGDHGNCSAIVFVKWPDQPRTVSARAIYTFNGQERSEVAAPPFHDTFAWVATYTVPPGYHWIQVGKSWKDGPLADTCEALSAKQRTRTKLTAAKAKQAKAVKRVGQVC